MSKKKAVIALILTILLGALVGFTAIVGFGKTGRGKAENIKLGLDLQGGVSITYEVVDKDFSETEFNDTKNKLEKRVNKFSTEAEVYKEGDNRITCNIPGEKNADTVLNSLGKPGSMYFATAVQDSEVTDDMQTIEISGQKFRVWLSGSDIHDAKAGTTSDSTNGKKEYVVNLTMTSSGKEKFAQATSENVNNILYIIYDDQIISAPRVNQALTDGTAQITGQSSLEEAEDLASDIRIGSLDLELKEITHSVVGAKLGQDALANSIKAGVIGLILVILFMCIVYRIPGVIAGISLILYTGFILVTLNAFDLTLTLPGIAGIVLSIGMAVDANVIIYARIREEIAAGTSVERAIKAGFSKATSAIVDGNVTTIIAALVLMWKGSGTVQGFAQTLAIGIIWSMVTALIVTRLLVNIFYTLGCKKPGLYGKEKKRKAADFVGKKAIFFTISILVIIAGVVTMIVQNARGKGAFNLSIEFQGGKAYNVEFDKDYSIDDFNDKIKPSIEKIVKTSDIQGQKETGSNKWSIKMPDVDESTITDMKKMLVKDYKAKEDSIEETFISASVSKEMSKNAVIATILATICMLIYIWFRFKDIKFAAAAVIALIHDVLVVIAFYAVSRTSVGTTFIACILTLVGYSINATIVIFDRIRENLAIEKNTDTKTIVNKSIMQTMTRSIYTSFTTFIMVAMIYILGVASIREFALPLMVGIICGAYSSVCITGALWYTFKKHGKKNK